MVIKRLLQSLAAGGPVVRTELRVSRAQPGGVLEGVIEVTGGERRVNIGHVDVVLTANSTLDFHRQEIMSEFVLSAGDNRVFPFVCEVPWESPLSWDGVSVGLRTELEVALALDRTDVDPVDIVPLPAQQHILDCLRAMGMQPTKSNLERGRLSGVPHSLPFYQEIEFSLGSTRYARHFRHLELTFVATQERLHVVVEVDRRVTPLSDPDVFGHFAVNPTRLHEIDWRALLDNWLDGLAV